MKNIVFAIIFASGVAHAQGLLDHVAFATAGIQAGCSDFLGRVASAGDISLRDFRIATLNPIEGCPVRAGGHFRLFRGSVENADRKGCIEASRVSVGQASVGHNSRVRGDLGLLVTEMHQMADSLRLVPAENAIRMVLGTDDFPAGGTLTLTGAKEKMLIVEVRGQQINMQYVGIKLAGGVRPENIAWVFPDATDITIAHSGVNPIEFGKHIGLPGTFFAPRARVVFLNALITGALYAHEILGPASQVDCSGQVAGQINPWPLRHSGGKP